MGGVLPDQPGGTSLDFGLLTDLFSVSADGEIPGLAGRDQPTIEGLLKQREIKESPGWLSAHDIGFFGLIPGVPLIANVIMTLVNSITGLPLGTWPGGGPLGFLGEIPNMIADIGNFFFNLTGFFGDIDFNDLLFDIPTAIFNFVDTMLLPTELIASLIGGLIPGFQIPGLDASKIVSGTFPLEMISGLLDVGGTIATSLLSVPISVITGLLSGGSILTSLIPGLDASKIITGNFPIAMITGLTGQLGDLTSGLQSVFNTAWNAIIGDDEEGLVDRTAADFATALQNIPALNVIGVGAATMVDTVTDILDKFWSGFARVTGSGKSTADVANKATEIANLTDQSMQLGEWNNAILGLRNNKSLMEGVDETEEANFLLPNAWGVGTEPVAAYAVTSSSGPVAYWRATETAKKGFISWFGKGITNVTELHIDIYRANYDTNTWDLLHSSANVIASATGSWSYIVYNLPEVDRIDVNSGDVLGVAWRVVGTGTHSVAGIPIAGLPEHPTIHPKKPVSARSGVGSLSFASTAYTANTVPWFGIGIVEGDTPPPFFAPRVTQYTTNGTFTYDIPEFANYIDVVLCGAGGGGQGGNPAFFVAGEGGDEGTWQGETLVRGVDFPEGTTTLSITVGNGGFDGGVNSNGGTGGASSRAAISGGKAALTAPGGTGGNEQGADANGDEPGDFVYQGVTYLGGAGGRHSGGKAGTNGTAPGAGGGGGSGGTWGVAFRGGKGGRGGAWVTARQS